MSLLPPVEITTGMKSLSIGRGGKKNKRGFGRGGFQLGGGRTQVFHNAVDKRSVPASPAANRKRAKNVNKPEAELTDAQKEAEAKKKAEDMSWNRLMTDWGLPQAVKIGVAGEKKVEEEVWTFTRQSKGPDRQCLSATWMAQFMGAEDRRRYIIEKANKEGMRPLHVAVLGAPKPTREMAEFFGDAMSNMKRKSIIKFDNGETTIFAGSFNTFLGWFDIKHEPLVSLLRAFTATRRKGGVIRSETFLLSRVGELGGALMFDVKNAPDNAESVMKILGPFLHDVAFVEEACETPGFWTPADVWIARLTTKPQAQEGPKGVVWHEGGKGVTWRVSASYIPAKTVEWVHSKEICVLPDRGSVRAELPPFCEQCVSHSHETSRCRWWAEAGVKGNKKRPFGQREDEVWIKVGDVPIVRAAAAVRKEKAKEKGNDKAVAPAPPAATPVASSSNAMEH